MNLNQSCGVSVCLVALCALRGRAGRGKDRSLLALIARPLCAEMILTGEKGFAFLFLKTIIYEGDSRLICLFFFFCSMLVRTTVVTYMTVRR